MENIDLLVTDPEPTPEPTIAVIRFLDGTELQTARNGDCFILPTRPAFPEDLSLVIVEIGSESMEYHNAKVQQCASVDGQFWFTFIEESPTTLKFRQIDHVEDQHQADIDYLLMLVDEE